MWSLNRGITFLELPKTASPKKINNIEQVAGTYTKEKVTRGFFWDPKMGFIDIGTLGGKHTWVTDLNNHGQIVGQSETRTKSLIEKDKNEKHAFLWQAPSKEKKQGIMKDLGTLPGDLGFRGDESVANSINDSGDIVGTSNTISVNKGKKARGLKQAVIWKDFKPEKVFQYVAGESSEGLVINNNSVAALLKNEGLMLKDMKTQLETSFAFPKVVHVKLNDQGILLINNATYFDTALVSKLPGPVSIACGEIMSVKNDSDGSWKSVHTFTDINSSGNVIGIAKTKSGQKHAIFIVTDG